MKKSELKKMLKPLIKEMVKEVIVKDFLGSIIAESVRGAIAAMPQMQPMQPQNSNFGQSAPSVDEQKIMRAAGLENQAANIMGEHASRLRNENQASFGGYAAPQQAQMQPQQTPGNLHGKLKQTPGALNDRMVAPAMPVQEGTAPDAFGLAGVAAGDPGVDISAFSEHLSTRGGKDYWGALAFDGDQERTITRKHSKNEKKRKI